MTSMRFNSATEFFNYACSQLNQPSKRIESAPRGMKTWEKLAFHGEITNPRNRIVDSSHRGVKPKYLAAELSWYFSGSRNVEMIAQYAAFWNTLVDPSGLVNSNYGAKLFYSYDRNGPDPLVPLDQQCQIVQVIQELTRDQDSRRAIANILLPEDKDSNFKDVPCTISLQFFIRDRKLHLWVAMRSNDLMKGFCNDVFQFTFIQEFVLALMKSQRHFSDLELGSYYHSAGSMHVYEPDFLKVMKICETNGFPDTELRRIQNEFPHLETFSSLSEAKWFMKAVANLKDDPSPVIENLPVYNALRQMIL